MKIWLLGFLAIAVISAVNSVAFANETENTNNFDTKHWDVSLGLFQLIHTDYLGSRNYEGTTLPYLDITKKWDGHNNYVFLRTTEGLGIQTRVGQGIAGVSIGYRGERDPDENKNLSGLTEVDDTATANLFFRYGHNQYNGGILISKGLIQENRGTLIKLHAGCNCQIKDKWYGSLGTFATWGDQDYMNDYFGVKASEATGTRAAYKAKSGFVNYGIKAGVSYMLDETQTLTASSSIYRLGKEARNSTFNEKEFGTSLTFGYIYQF